MILSGHHRFSPGVSQFGADLDIPERQAVQVDCRHRSDDGFIDTLLPTTPALPPCSLLLNFG